MSASTTAMSSATSTRGFWERLWRLSGINFVVFAIIAYVIYGYQPQVGASADALAAFYDGRGCGARRLGRGSDRLERSGRRTVSRPPHGKRSPRVLDRRLRKSGGHSGTE